MTVAVKTIKDLDSSAVLAEIRSHHQEPAETLKQHLTTTNGKKPHDVGVSRGWWEGTTWHREDHLHGIKTTLVLT